MTAHPYDDNITNMASNTDYWRLDRDTDGLDNLKNTGVSAITASGTSAGENILPGTNNLYSELFDGSTSYLFADINRFTALPGSLSVEAWIRPSDITLGDFTGIAVKSGAFGLCLCDGQPAFFTFRSTDTDKRVVQGDFVLSVNMVYHLLGTYNYATGMQKIYVNGKQVGQQTFGSGATWQNAQGLVVGSWDTSNLFFAGEISNVALYDTALYANFAASQYTWYQ